LQSYKSEIHNLFALLQRQSVVTWEAACEQNVNVNLAGIGSFQQRQANLDSYGRVASAGGTMPTWAQHVKSVSRQGSEPDGIAEIIL
jgi:hypothetical protein